MTLPDIRSMLPSQAREALKAYFLRRLKESGLNYLGDPRYSRSSAEYIRDLGPLEGWASSAIYAIYTEAEQEYDRQHPKFFLPGGGIGREGLTKK